MARKTKATLVKELAGAELRVNVLIEERNRLIDEKMVSEATAARCVRAQDLAQENSRNWYDVMKRTQDELDVCRSERNAARERVEEVVADVRSRDACIARLNKRLETSENVVGALESNLALAENNLLHLKAKIAERLLGV